MNPSPYAAIHWEDIDAEVRPLVALLNSTSGIQTTDSCAGHARNDEAYVTFTADDVDALGAVLACLPNPGWQGCLMANRWEWSAVWVSVSLWEGRLWYTLHIQGDPLYVQRRALQAVEDVVRTHRGSSPATRAA